MLWIGGQITALEIIKGVFIPSAVSLLIPLVVIAIMLKGKVVISPNSDTKHTKQNLTNAFEKNVMLWLKEKISILPESNKYKIWTNINVYKLGENEQVRNNKNNLFYNQKNISDPKGEIDIMIVYVNKDFIIPLLVIECKTSMAGVYHDIRRMNTMIEMLSSLPKIRNIKTPWGDKQLIDTIQWNNVRYIIEENVSSIDINHPYFLNMA